MIGPILGGSNRQPFRPGLVNMVFDGNSLTWGNGGGPWPDFLASMAPLNGYATIRNFAVNGQTTEQMNSSPSDVDNAWADGKLNVLVLWEGTNSMAGGNRTAQQAFDSMANYITGRKALQPWRVVLINTLPRQASTQAATDLLNAKLDEYNALLKSNLAQMGGDLLVDLRQDGSPFKFADYLMQTFEDAAAAGNWKGGETGAHVHLNGAGYIKVAQMVAVALRRLPARPQAT